MSGKKENNRESIKTFEDEKGYEIPEETKFAMSIEFEKLRVNMRNDIKDIVRETVFEAMDIKETLALHDNWFIRINIPFTKIPIPLITVAGGITILFFWVIFFFYGLPIYHEMKDALYHIIIK